jgi:Zn-dependent peptidase ImmA (M78 family)
MRSTRPRRVEHQPRADPDVVSTLERHGIVCARYHVGTHAVDALSVPFPERPVTALGDDKAKRHRERFSAAHELGLYRFKMS